MIDIDLTVAKDDRVFGDFFTLSSRIIARERKSEAVFRAWLGGSLAATLNRSRLRDYSSPVVAWRARLEVDPWRGIGFRTVCW